ncbi:4923_t:CDS:2, partial [Funneliformis caledonium]
MTAIWRWTIGFSHSFTFSDLGLHCVHCKNISCQTQKLRPQHKKAEARLCKQGFTQNETNKRKRKRGDDDFETLNLPTHTNHY